MVDKVVISSTGIDTVFSISEDDQFHVTCYENDRYKFKISESGEGTLSVEEQDIKKFTIFELPSDLQEVTIEVPKAFCGNIDITIEMAKVFCDGISAGNIDIKSDGGKIELDNIDVVESLTINGYRDAISMVNITVGQEISVINEWETIYFQNFEFGSNLKIENHWGDINGNIKGKLADYSLISKIEYGECNLPADLAGGKRNIYIENSWGDIKVDFDE